MTVLALAAPPVAAWGHASSVRLIPSRFPPVGLFDRVARPEELDAVFAVQALTHPRIRQELGQIHLVPPAERVVGEGSSPVMAAFCHLNPEGSRFSDGSWGVYYAAESLDTAVAEVSFHRARFLAATSEPPIELDMRAYLAGLPQPLHDLRGPGWEAEHRADDYRPGQGLARRLRAEASWGLAYRSVRRPGGECAAILRPRGVSLPVRQGPHVSLAWDGQRIARWYRKSDLQDL